MGTKICPICDGKVNSINFCKTCKRFVTPIETSHTFYLNERREPEDYQREYQYSGDVSDYSADKPEVEDEVTDCHDEFETELPKWANRTPTSAKPIPNPDTTYTTKKKSKKAEGVISGLLFLAAIGVCFRTSSLWDVWQQYRDEQELQDSLDEMHEMMDEQDEDMFVDEDGYSYRYIYQPGEITDYGTDSLVGLSADEVYDRGEACDGVAHYEGVTSDELEADFLQNAEEDGILFEDTSTGTAGNLSLYEYSYQNGDTFTYYNKEKYISDDECGIDVSINSDLNTPAIHSVRIWQYPPDVDDGFCLDQIYEDLVMALEDETLQGDSLERTTEMICAYQEKEYSADDSSANYTELQIGKWSLTISRGETSLGIAMDYLGE